MDNLFSFLIPKCTTGISNQIIDFVNQNYKVEKWFLFKFDKIQLKRKQLHITFKNKIDFI